MTTGFSVRSTTQNTGIIGASAKYFDPHPALRLQIRYYWSSDIDLAGASLLPQIRSLAFEIIYDTLGVWRIGDPGSGVHFMNV